MNIHNVLVKARRPTRHERWLAEYGYPRLMPDGRPIMRAKRSRRARIRAWVRRWWLRFLLVDLKWQANEDAGWDEVTCLESEAR